ncbi:MAG TPA: amidohydrolase family protein [Bryobacteraceae bacterium]|nr:amidohydrolase family protein [Bryobacteraceae bacterium]
MSRQAFEVRSKRRNRREFLRNLAAGAMVGAAFRNASAQEPGGAAARREVRVGGKRVKVVDVHAHANFPEVADVVKDGPLARFARGRPLGPDRLRELDKRGIDVQALSVNVYWWYEADRDLAAKIIQTHDEGLAKWCAAHPDRFVGLSSPALQFPDLAAEQLEHAIKQLGMRGASVGGSVNGEPLSLPKYDPFWAKAQELGALVFMHPNNAETIVKPDALHGAGDLGNVIGNPFETTLFLSHLIFDGTLDRFPGLKVCGAHAGGYLPSYMGRVDVACDVRPNAKCANKKKPREYFHEQILADSMIFSAEGIRHMVAEMGPSQIVYGTDMPFVWPDTVDAILEAEIPDAQKEAILGGNLVKLLRL